MDICAQARMRLGMQVGVHYRHMKREHFPVHYAEGFYLVSIWCSPCTPFADTSSTQAAETQRFCTVVPSWGQKRVSKFTGKPPLGDGRDVLCDMCRPIGVIPTPRRRCVGTCGLQSRHRAAWVSAAPPAPNPPHPSGLPASWAPGCPPPPCSHTASL